MQYRIQLERIYVADGHSFLGRAQGEPAPHPMREVETVECVAGQGLRGDRFFAFRPDYKGQATFFSAEVFDEVRSLSGDPELAPSAPRRNIVLRGVDLNDLVGQRFEIGGVRFEGVEECAPCEWMDRAIGAGAKASLRGRGGLRARILTSGSLRRGRAVLQLIP